VSEHRVVIVGQQGSALAHALLALGHIVQHVPSCRRLLTGLPSGLWDACILVVDQLTAHDANLIRNARQAQPQLAVLLCGSNGPGLQALARLTGADDVVLPGHPRAAARRIADAITRRQARLPAPAGSTPAPAPVDTSAAVHEAKAKREIAQFAAGITHEIDNPATYVTANLTAVSKALGTLAWEQRGQGELSNRLDELDKIVRESLTGMARIRSITRDLRTATSVGLLSEPPFASEPASANVSDARESRDLLSPASSQLRPRVVPGSPEGTREATTPRLRLLLIDDEPLVLRSLRRMLSQHSVVIATGGVEALAKLESRADYDLVLCDLVMPDLDGTEVHAAITRRFPQLLDRLVFFTGGALSSRTRAFLEQSTQPLVHKPLTLASFNEVAARVLGRARAPRAQENA
jgi:CheY-like chemotaxis protein